MIDQQFAGLGDHLFVKIDGFGGKAFGNALFGNVDPLLFEVFDDGVEPEYFIWRFCCSSNRRRSQGAKRGR
jgi:hypothetical protein